MLVGLITAIISVIVVFNHQLIWLLAIFPGLYIIYALFITFSKAPALKEDLETQLTLSEKEAWAQHHAFLRFPSASMGMSHTLSLLQFISVALAIALLLSGLYWGIIFALFWSLGILVPRLNPTTTYIPAAQKGDQRAVERVQALGSLQRKLEYADAQPKAHTVAEHNKPKQVPKSKKFEGLSEKTAAALNRIKEQQSGKQSVIALLAKFPHMERETLKLRHDVPDDKTTFAGVVSFSSSQLYFTFLDYKEDEDRYLTRYLLSVSSIVDVYLNKDGTTMTITDKDGEETGFITLMKDDLFANLALAIRNNVQSSHAHKK